MAQTEPGSLLDFSAYVGERAERFTGREWVFKRVGEWLADQNGRRWFLLTGEPGSGKTAIAARLLQISSGAHEVPATAPNVQPGFLAASHFCFAREATWVDPAIFAKSLALQLRGCPGFSEALLEHAASRGVSIQGEVQAERVEANAIVAGVYIANLTIPQENPGPIFNQLIALPLRTLFARGRTQPITLLVDGLDEAVKRQGETSIVTLLSAMEQLPKQVRFILTSRPDDAVEREILDAEVLNLSAPNARADARTDLRRYVANCLPGVPSFETLDASTREAAAATIVEKADGNFRYAQFLLEALTDSQHTLDDLAHLPPGLDALYHGSLLRILNLTSASWAHDFEPLLGALSAAREPLTLSQLRRFSNQQDARLWENLRRLRQFVEELPPLTAPDRMAGHVEDDQYRYRLYHESVAELFSRRWLKGPQAQIPNAFYLNVRTYHRRIADAYLAKLDAEPWWTWDLYGLRYATTHQAEGADREDSAIRHNDVERLVRLVLAPDFQTCHLERLDDPAALEHDLELACAQASLDDTPAGLPLLVKTSLARVIFRRERLRPDAVFTLARQGRVEEAARRLALFSTDRDWRQATMLILAWLGARLNPKAAWQLCEQVLIQRPALKRTERYPAGHVREESSDEPLLDLLELATAAIDGRAAIRRRLVLERFMAPPVEVVREALARIGGMGSNTELLRAYGSSLMSQVIDNGDAAPVYMAQEDGPLLVAYAAAEPEEGMRYLLDYLSVHAGYAYPEYRNRSLWALLDAVVRHDSVQWVEQMVPLLATTALSNTTVQFQDGLPITIQALRAAAGLPGAMQEVEATIGRALEQRPQSDASYTRGEGDLWGIHRRRFAGLAEALTVALGRTEEADQLLDVAEDLPRGFAGFQAPACLRLAEAVRICRPGDEQAEQKLLEAARNAAHNIQDPLFCARTTARVNALRSRWWGTGSLVEGDLAGLALRLARTPGGPEFAAVHLVGERYEKRTDDDDKVELPGWVRGATTLEELSRVYERLAAELRQLNRARHDWSTPQQLSPGTLVYLPQPVDESDLRILQQPMSLTDLAGSGGWLVEDLVAANTRRDPALDVMLEPETRVNVPDPGLAALVASRISAEVLARPAPANPRQHGQRLEILRSLVPIAAQNPTVLDVVLSRLLLAARPTDPEMLNELDRLAQQGRGEGMPSGHLPAALTGFVP